MLVLLVSVYVLFAPRPGGPEGPPGADKAVHLLLFLLLALTSRARFGPRPGVLALLLAYAALSEVAQAVLLPARSGDLPDVVADAAGVGLGWLLARRATGT